jgi:amino acid adenylation domain-containing protein
MTHPPAPAPPRNGEIAVVGMACRFPGVRTPEDLWSVLVQGQETIATFKAEDMRAAGIPEGRFTDPAYVPRGSALGDIDLFDAGFFGFSPREAALLDPQGRLFLECAWRALEDGGHANEDPNRDIGVFGGVALNTYFHNNLATNPDVLEDFGFFQTLISNDKDYLTTLASYKLNLTGPGVTVQTACSTSLVAIHMACQSLLTGECDLALAGGVNLTVPEIQGYLFQPGMINSPDGSCRPFSAESAGTTNGAGCGIVLLQPVAEALESGSTIHAIIRGSAVNNDGARKVGYTAPGLEGQVRAIAEAQRVAEVAPWEVGFVETHGTATPLGDPIEVAALARVWTEGAQTSPDQATCILGAVKGNLGHTGVTAGVAGFLKAVLAAREGVIPPTPHFTTPNPDLHLETTPFRINSQPERWDTTPDQPERIAGVSSFGIGGTNAHVVLAENRFPSPSAPPTARPIHLLPLSAHSPQALEEARTALLSHLKANPEVEPGAIAHSLQRGRKAFPYRLAVTGTDSPSLIAALDRLESPASAPAAAEKRRIAFMMTGHGSQSTTMARQLLQQEPVFRARFDQLANRLKQESGLDLKAVLSGQDDAWAQAQIQRMAVSQSLMYVIQLSLCALWRSWGVIPDVVLGHSSGEFAAAVEAGVFSAEEGLKLTLGRGRLMDQSVPGGMITLNYSERELARFIGPDLSVAVVNAPDLCVVSGAEAPLDAFAALMTEREVDFRRLHISAAAHSPTMEAIQGEFAALARTVPYSPPRLPYLSSVTGQWSDGADIARPDYWIRHLRATVRFGEAVAHLVTDPEVVLVEIGPGNALSTFARMAAIASHVSPPVCIQSLAKPAPEKHQDEAEADDHIIAASVGRLWVAGGALDWKGYRVGQLHRLISLPPLPLQRRRCWITPPTHSLQSEAETNRRPPTPLVRQTDPELWFHRPDWRRADVRPAATTPQTQRTVLWLHEGEGHERDTTLFSLVKERLSDHRTLRVIPVTLGKGCRISAEEASIRRDNAGDFDRILRIFSPDIVVYAVVFGSTDTKSQEEIPGFNAFQSLCLLGQALGLRLRTPADIIVLSRGIFDITGSEDLSPPQALLLGPLKVIPQEFPHLRTALHDLDPTAPLDALARQAENAILANRASPIEAIRGPHHWVPDYRPQRLSDKDSPCRALRTNGVYLITGGLGGLGLTIADHLARTHQARLALVGRSPLPPRSEWSQTAEGPKAEVMHRLLKMEQAGGQIRTFAVDCTDEAAMAGVFEAVEATWGPIHGVIHAAGDIGYQIHGALDQFSPEQSQAQFQAKVAGTDILVRLLENRTPDFVVLMSSMASILGGLGFAAYGAVNAYLDAIATKAYRDAGTAWLSMNWDRWIPTGQEETETGPQHLSGHELAPQEGMAAFLRVLRHLNSPQIMVTPGDLQGRLAQWIDLPPRDRSPSSPELDTGPKNLQSEDRTRPEDGSRPQEPMTQTQSILAAIWRRLLGHVTVSLDDNFFDLGGHSLLATRVLDQIRRALGVTPPMKALFDCPTIRGLSALLDTENGRTALLSETPEEPAIQGPQDPLDGASSPPLPSPGSPAPLTQAQKQLWLVDRMEMDAGLYTIPLALRLQGNLPSEALEKALSALIARHETLRLFCYLKDGEPMQGFMAPRPIVLQVIDIEPGDEEAAITRESQIRFDLSRAPLIQTRLLRVSSHDHILVLVLHHITADGWSIGLLLKDLAQLYTGFRRGEPVTLPPLERHYGQYAHWQATHLGETEIARQLAYWRNQLADLPPRHALPMDNPLPDRRDFSAEVVDLTLTAETTNALRQLAETESASLFMVLLAAFTALLFRVTGVPDQPVITSSANRKEGWQEDIVGLFVAMLVLRPQARGDQIFRDLIRETRRVTLEAFAHSDVPLRRIVEDLNPVRHPSQHPLSQIGFVVQNMPLEDQSSADLCMNYISSSAGACQYDVLCSISEEKDQLHIHFEYGRELFDKKTIKDLLRRYATLIAGALEYPDRPIADLPLISPEEEHALKRWGNTGMAPSMAPSLENGATLIDMVRHQARQTPEALALVHGERTWTYAELIAAMAAQAEDLATLGLSQGDIIAVSLPRGPERVIAFLGILALGALYLPLDPAQPAKRLEAIRADAQPQAEITATGVLSHSAKPAARMPPSRPSPKEAAYIIYTSGSTGVPKGVVLGHAGLAELAQEQRTLFAIGPGDRVLQLAAASFDAWIWEVAMAVTAGGTLVTADEDAVQAGAALHALLRTAEITHLTITPPALSALPLEPLPSLRTLICAGAALPPSLARRWAIDRDLYNAYGPTEVTVCATVGRCDPKRDQFNIGRPLSHLSVHILDPQGTPVPPGIAGELHVGGIGLAHGYLNRPDLTRERFIPNPVPGAAHDRLYATGDRALFRPDPSGETADIVFLGRLDDQLELCGFRVEPAEVEHCLLTHPLVVQAAIIGFPRRQPDRLVAYVVLDQAEGPDITPAALRAHVAQHLPAHMVPSFIIPLTQLPLTVAGKLDIALLPPPSDGKSDQQDIAPSNPMEARLHSLWTKVLGVPRVGRTTGFFEAGGTSLLAVKLVTALRSEIGVDLSIAELFSHPTLAALAAHLDTTSTAGTSDRTGMDPLASEAPLAGKATAGHPFFWFGGLGAHAMSLSPLATCLADLGPVYALFPRGTDGKTAPDRDPQIMITRLVETIRRIQPAGPYRLGGHSLGCKLAWMVAEHLTNDGAQVDGLCLLDGAAPDQILYQGESPPSPSLLRSWALGALGEIAGPEGLGTGTVETVAPRDLDRMVQSLLAALPLANIIRSPGGAPLDIPTLIFVASRQQGTTPTAAEAFGADLGWGDFVQSPQIRAIEATHWSLLRQPQVAQVAEQWRRFDAKG